MSTFIKVCAGNSFLKSLGSQGSLNPVRCYAFGASKRSPLKKKKAQSSATSVSASSALKDLPVLIPGSGKSEIEVVNVIRDAAANARDPKLLYLHHCSYQNSAGAQFRGYGLIPAGGCDCQINGAPSSRSPRPVWLIFPGILGSHCASMPQELLKIKPFAESIARCKEICASKFRVNVDTFFKPADPVLMTYVYSSLLAMTTVQIALLDTLKSLGLKPDGFIGHSTGELLCAYADGCLSAQETLEVADAQGRACQQLKNFAMADVPLSWTEAETELPSDVELVGTNGTDSVVVGGKSDVLKRFVQEFNEKKPANTAQLIETGDFALHGTWAEGSADLLKGYFKGKIKGERVRSSKWISTSMPAEEGKSVVAKWTPAEYFANNLKSPVRFYEALQRIPPRALVIEVSPYGGLQKVLIYSTQDCVHVALMKRNVKDKLSQFYDSVGQMFIAGCDLEITKLYHHGSDALYQPLRV